MEAYFWYEVWANFVVAVLAQLSVSHLRERGEAVERLAQAQDRGLAARQQLARAQLQAIQARVDPQLLFETLKAVKRFYQHETERAERLLDELAAFLRAALPRLRSTRSTLELEFQMVASYARLQQIGFERPVALHVDLPSELVNEGFPAGLLLPLSISLLEGQAEPRIELAASADEQRLRVSVLVNAAPADAAWERLAAALHDLYGGRATCRQVPAFPPRPSAADVNLELEVPREPA
jgi:LytS/YehU family sensor histidine kinase